jgi:hypothetical protein
MRRTLSAAFLTFSNPCRSGCIERANIADARQSVAGPVASTPIMAWSDRYISVSKPSHNKVLIQVCAEHRHDINASLPLCYEGIVL